MDNLQKKIEAAIIDTLVDTEGAGSDLSRVLKASVDSQWLYVEGNLDVQHLASHVMEVLGLDYEYCTRYIPHPEEPDFYFQSGWGPYAKALENQKLANDGRTFIYQRLKTGTEEQQVG